MLPYLTIIKKVCCPLLLLFFILPVFFGCEPEKCTAAPPSILLRFVNAQQSDLLDPANPGAYQLNEMQLTFDNKGVNTFLQLAVNPVPGTDSFFLAAGINGWATKGQTFYLRLNPADTDTIYVRMESKGCSSELKEATYNGIPVMLKGIVQGFPGVYEIVK